MSDITITSSNSMSSVANRAYVANTQTTKADNTVADDVKNKIFRQLKIILIQIRIILNLKALGLQIWMRQ